MYLTLLIVIALFDVCHNYVSNNIHYRTVNETEYLLDDGVDLSELSEEDLARLRFNLVYPGLFNNVTWRGDVMTSPPAWQWICLTVRVPYSHCNADLCITSVVTRHRNDGTKWCGPGDIANGYDDLGPAVKEDMCCRDHDYCSDTISPGETKYNLTNEAFYTRLSCECDEKFRMCMLDVNSRTSKIIGLMYFNVIGTKCFREDYPVTGCVKKGGWLGTKCIIYSYDTSGEPIYQWFDVPNYKD